METNENANPLDSARSAAWPALPLAEWKETCATLHMWTQVVGNVRLALSPHVNHFWEVPLYVNARGLTTSAIPYRAELFEVQFDLINHRLEIESSWGGTKALPLIPRSVADFYREFMAALHSLGIDANVWPMPVEVLKPVRFDEDTLHATYDSDHAQRFWRVLVTADTILKEFRARFIGKDSPVHFFWGSFDLAVSRFSGRPAPPRPGADSVTREACSHEVSSAGFWPGSGPVPDAAFYSYTVPEPMGFAQSSILPQEAFYCSQLHEFVLLYEDVRQAPSPRETLLNFLQSTYEAAANLGNWDRQTLERQEPMRLAA